MRTTFNTYTVNVLNASIRYVPADKQTVMSYAPRDCFSVVLYINVIRLPYVFENARKWSQQLIDAALSCGGTYYLPYHFFARPDQFNMAYPNTHQLITIKNTYDPHHKFRNSLIDTYIMLQ